MVDLKELKALVKYLRKEGITEFKNGDLEFKLGETPTKQKRAPKINSKIEVSEQVNIDTDYPTEEEMLYYSAGGMSTEEQGN